jgi:hypothetical protein
MNSAEVHRILPIPLVQLINDRVNSVSLFIIKSQEISRWARYPSTSTSRNLQSICKSTLNASFGFCCKAVDLLPVLVVVILSVATGFAPVCARHKSQCPILVQRFKHKERCSFGYAVQSSKFLWNSSEIHRFFHNCELPPSPFNRLCYFRMGVLRPIRAG